MLNKYIVFILVIFIFWTILSFAQEAAEFTRGEKNIGITQMKAAAAKLKKDMTRDEVETLLGKPTFYTGTDSVYWFEGEENLMLRFDSSEKLFLASNRDGFNLLDTEYIAQVADNYPFYIDGEKVSFLNPIIYINQQMYISIEDFEKYLVKEIVWDAKTNQLEITKNIPVLNKQQTESGHKYWWISGSRNNKKYVAFPVDCLVFIDGEKIFISNPVTIIEDKIYLPVEELQEELAIRVIFDMQQYSPYMNSIPGAYFEITKDVPVTVDLFRKRRTYPALVVDFPIFVDGKELLTINPILTIYGKIYLPIEEVEEDFGIKVWQNMTNPFPPTIIPQLESLKIDRIADVSPGIKDKAGIIKFKEDISKLRIGMTEVEVEQILGEPQSKRNANTYINFAHETGGILISLYDSSHKLTAVLNSNHANLLATGYVLESIKLPILIGVDKVFVFSPIFSFITIKTVYLPIEDLAEYFGAKAEWNEEKTELNITTKQEKK